MAQEAETTVSSSALTTTDITPELPTSGFRLGVGMEWGGGKFTVTIPLMYTFLLLIFLAENDTETTSSKRWTWTKTLTTMRALSQLVFGF